jgi:hypothetical protein
MISILFLCLLAFADDDVVTVQKGEPAPFSGTLLSPAAAARLLAKGEKDLATCLADAKRDQDLLEAQKTFEVQTAEAKLAQCTLESQKKQELYLERIDWLEKKVSPPSWQGPVLFAGGVVAGMGVVVLSAWTLDKIQEN